MASEPIALESPTTALPTRAQIERILRSAMGAGASDVHLKTGEPVLLRVRGRLQALKSPRLSPEDTRRLIEALLPPHLEGIDLDRLRDLDFSFGIPGLGRFRANAFRQRASLALVVRVIPLEVPKLADLNLPEVMPALADSERGLILVTGATGSGKSTTIAALIDHINNTRTSHVVTIEDPIEFFFRNRRSSVVQREIGPDSESFGTALRAALRQDPDVVMIGEMRDTETIDIALKAAETGHLVMSTAHTTDAARTIQRVLSVFPPTEQAMLRMRLSESLRAVVSQRLLPRADGAGLVPAAEVLVVTRVVQECIRNPERTFEIKEFISKGKHYGMQTFDQALLELFRAGTITREVALSAATSPGDLDLWIRMGVAEEEEFSIERHSHTDQAREEGDTI